MKVLVTGRTGQVARALVERCEGQPAIELVALGRPELDLEQPQTVAAAIRSVAPDVVINAAAYTAVDQAEDHPERAFRVNGEGAGQVARLAQEADAAIVQLSTDYVFDGQMPRSYREDDPVNPLGVYGCSKLEGEEQVRAANSRHIIVRTAWVYSPWERNFVKSMMKAAENRDILNVVGDQRGSPTSALDLADAILHVLDGWETGSRFGLGETYHVAGGGETNWSGFAQEIMNRCQELGLPYAKVHSITTADWPTRAKRPRNSVLDSSKFERDFGLRQREWREAVGEAVVRLAAQP